MIPILMTASVSTRGMKDALYTDEERERMYMDTLEFYRNKLLKNSGQKLVFVENSGWNLTNIKRGGGDNIEFISLDPNEFDIDKGKGYNELLLINKALQLSKVFIESKCFFKITGRYPIINLKHFLEKAESCIMEENMDYYGDMQDYTINDCFFFRMLHLTGTHHVGEARLFASKIDFYLSNIGNRYYYLNDSEGCMVENLLYDVMKNASNISKRFDREPHFGGLEGSYNDSFWFTQNQDSLKGKVKRYFGNFIRSFFPNFWQ